MFLEILRACYGLLELTAPDKVSGTALGKQPDEKLRVVLRILGARHLVQAGLTLAAPKSMHRVGGTVDLIHSGSMLLLAAFDKGRRRAAVTNAAVAALFAAGEFRGE